MMKRSISRLGWIFILIAVGIIAAVIWGTLQNHTQSSDKIHVEIVSVPTDATVKLNGERVDKSIYVTPGNYSVSGYMDGFYPENYRLDITDEDQKVFVVLNPLSDSAVTWYNNHQSAYSEVQSQIEQQTLSSTTAFADKNPIITKLPYENYLYKISYKINPNDPTNQSIIITIDAPEQYRAMAIAKVAELADNLYAYSYEYTDFTNVFKGAE